MMQKIAPSRLYRVIQFKHLSYVAASLIIFTFVISCSNPQQLAGSISETTNGAVTGTVVYATGGGAKGAQVKLLPADYDPCKDSIHLRLDTADSNGMYNFLNVDSGSYNVYALHDNGKLRAVTAVRVYDALVPAQTDTLKQPGKIEMMLPDSFTMANGYFYVPGTDIFVYTGNKSGFVLLDSVPAVTLSSICFATKNGTAPAVVIRYEIPVLPGKSDTIFNPAWRYARAFFLNTTASGARTSATVTGFPVLVRLTSSNFDFNQALPDGRDCRFTKADNTFLPFEIERWDPAGGHAELWVGIDTVFGNDSGHCYTMYWGASSVDPTTPSPAAVVFDTSASGGAFQAVWHFSEPTNSIAFDATTNGYIGVPMGNPAPVSAAGIIGNAASFNGKSSYFEMPHTASSTLNFPEHGTYSLSAWVNVDALTGGYQMIASKGDKQYNLEIKGGTNEWEFVEYQDTVGFDETTSKASAKTWVYLTGVRSNKKEYLYVNGTCVDSTIYNLHFSPIDTTYAEKHGLRTTTNNFIIGKMDDYPKFYFGGKIDEVRVSSTALSADWIKLCYMNQKDSDMLIRFK